MEQNKDSLFEPIKTAWRQLSGSEADSVSDVLAAMGKRLEINEQRVYFRMLGGLGLLEKDGVTASLARLRTKTCESGNRERKAWKWGAR